MKKTVVLTAMILVSAFAKAQLKPQTNMIKPRIETVKPVNVLQKKTSVNGKMLIKNKSALEIKLKNGNVVDLFKDFKMGKYPINFNFEGFGTPRDEQERGIVLFEFVTELYRNGKLIRAVKREPMPFFPGEMLEPVETFDIISLLTSAQGNPLKNGAYPGKLDKGKYSIKVKAIPLGVSGKIQEVTIVVWI